ncbi:MAG: helix-turn-helix domain-containing protein [Gemmataceae bacterium]|nr:helix-turn-helix domain-containing protein [Gemmataceae bacterium]MCI0741123.1 helix-turn-helix domain-containing protein [Gemmataceae bacterium]
MNEQVSFTINEAADLCGLSATHAQELRNWIAKGRIAPLVPGGQGPRNPHRLSAQTVVGLAVAMPRLAIGLFSVPKTIECIRNFGAMTDSARDHFLGNRKDVWSDEAIAAWVARHPLLQPPSGVKGWFDYSGENCDPAWEEEDKALAAKIVTSLDRLKDVCARQGVRRGARPAKKAKRRRKSSKSK